LVDLVRLGYGPVPYQKAYAWEVVGDELGVHTWGIAVHLGVPGEGPGELVAAALVRHGLVWSEADPCHFQLATGYWVE
jgi:hypothetical protein